MYKNILLTSLIAIFYSSAISQTTITISAGVSWTDAMIVKSLNSPSEDYKANTNYNIYPRFGATAWTHSGNQITYRSLLKFDLSTIPFNATVSSAIITFYSDPAYNGCLLYTSDAADE